MRRFLCALPLLALALGSCAAEDHQFSETASEAKAGAHFLGEPTCTPTGETLRCEGSVAGLGNQTVVAIVEVEQTCTNRGGNQPGGLATGTSAPITPENGRIDFAVVVSGDCPDRMTVGFSSPATVTLLNEAGEEVFSGIINF
jgi:hypothetical protein